jgi:hypothetical protein
LPPAKWIYPPGIVVELIGDRCQGKRALASAGSLREAPTGSRLRPQRVRGFAACQPFHQAAARAGFLAAAI